MGKCKRKIVAFALFITMAMPILAKPTETYAASSKSSKIITLAKKQLGKKYVWAKSGPSSFDCSGFTYYVIKKTTGKTIPRSSTSQGKYGKYVRVSHAGIYLGNNQFIHASSSKGKVVISSMASGHYYKTFVNGRRVA